MGGAFVPMLDTPRSRRFRYRDHKIDALFIHGLNPGPMLMVEMPDMFWFIVSALARVESPPRLMKGVPSNPLSLLLFAAIVLIFISKSPLCGMVFRRRT